jgi:hypothetical protein
MKATGPVAGAPARKTPVVSNPKLPLTPALVQVGEPCFTPNPDEVAPGFWKRNKKPVAVTTKETFTAGWLPTLTLAVTVQFEATAYVAVIDSVVITPSWDDVFSPVYVPVVESNVTWLAPMVGVPFLSVPPCRNP